VVGIFNATKSEAMMMPLCGPHCHKQSSEELTQRREGAKIFINCSPRLCVYPEAEKHQSDFCYTLSHSQEKKGDAIIIT